MMIIDWLKHMLSGGRIIRSKQGQQRRDVLELKSQQTVAHATQQVERIQTLQERSNGK